MKSLRLHLAYKNIRRLRTIVTVFAKYGFRPFMEKLRLGRLISVPYRLLGAKVAREVDKKTMPVRLRLALEELGPTFIKFGQILSTRPDVMPEEFIEELLKLQDEVAPIPFSEVQTVVSAQFGKPVEDLFSSIEDKPVAAASIAQVHRAVTYGNNDVVVKVQRPGIEGLIETDIAILTFLAKLTAKYIPESRLYDPAGMVDEFSHVLRREMDFTLEASYTERFRENFMGDARVFIPMVYWDLTGQKVLTMERAPGIKVDRIEKLKEAEINTEKVAHLIADVFFKQVFEFGLFHGDLHSGNIFVIAEDRIALVDFGIVGRLDNVMKQHLADILISFATEDFEGLTKIYQRMGILPEDIDKASFEREYYDIMLHYFGRPFKYVKFGELLLDYIRIAARHNIRLPRELLLFDKCILELEGLSRLLYPEVNILEESEPYARKLYMERMAPSTVIKKTADTFGEYKELVEKFPAKADKILQKLMDDKLRIEFFHRGLEDLMGEMDRSSNRLTLGLIVAALVVGSSLVIAAEGGPQILGVPALGLIGFVIASVLGLWLALQIIRSGKF